MGAIGSYSSFCASLSPFLLFQQAAQAGKIHFLSESLLNLAEIADVPSPFERKGLHLTVSCIGSEGNGGDQPPQRRSSSGRTNKNDGTKKKREAGGKKSKASDQEEIISLFRRIQTSISNKESVNAKKINSNVSEDSPSSESILQALYGSRKQKAQLPRLHLNTHMQSFRQGRQGVWTRKKDAQEQQIQEDPSVAEFKLTRPPSKFVKRSPIPSQSIRRVQVLELNNGASPSAAGRIEEMKLPELKELAKTRGIKGYSKLKKSELVQLLKS
ncbi:SAP-like protein BP-73 [Prunus yedoensis var. nudiflora]|uniref:SAP-like protein BP-73 n=1 Tax=Prunus yedoensis var. nudiflora TaxID=2094558 RepID=A0A314V2Z4_PRUYE|nr:SAP-like protein BP-73 [Prunus yedoensis var. nudiflora]